MQLVRLGKKFIVFAIIIFIGMVVLILQTEWYSNTKFSIGSGLYGKLFERYLVDNDIEYVPDAEIEGQILYKFRRKDIEQVRKLSATALQESQMASGLPLYSDCQITFMGDYLKIKGVIFGEGKAVLPGEVKNYQVKKADSDNLRLVPRNICTRDACFKNGNAEICFN